MAKKKRTDPTQPVSLLDALARDLNRTQWHGTRVATNDGLYKPAAIATGQQIRLDLPTKGDLNFEFTVGPESSAVLVANADAANSQNIMKSTLANPTKYLKLDVDTSVPTWTYHQRQFSLAGEAIPFADEKTAIVPMSSAAVQEVQRVGRPCDVSLWHSTPDNPDGDSVPTTWQPAILIRLGLQTPKTDGRQSAAPQDTVFELVGAPQGDRYFLDQLGLLPNDSVPDAPEVAGIQLFFEQVIGGQTPKVLREPILAWTLVRTNLTQEARPGPDLGLSTPATWPYVATTGQDEDTLRLLQMASITNSGGYFFRGATTLAPTSLVVCVLLTPKAASHDLSVSIPRAANAIAFQVASPVPNVAQFEETECIQVKPFVPPGYVAFGWTRSEPVTKADDEENYGFGTISLVAYDGRDAAGNGWESANSGTAISPATELPGDNIKTAPSPLIQGGPFTQQVSRGTAALRLIAPRRLKLLTALGIRPISNSDPGLRYYRGTMCCYDPAIKESPYAPLGMAARRAIAISPSFRDIFGNLFQSQPADIHKGLFYTDALIGPAEWPGCRISLYPGTSAGVPIFTVELAYTTSGSSSDKDSRLIRLNEILNQISGATSDTTVSLVVPPLRQTPIDLSQQIIRWITNAIGYEKNSGSTEQTTLTVLPPYTCDVSTLSAPTLIQPKIQITRSDQSLWPQSGDLPTDGTLSRVILDEITSVASPVTLAAAGSPSLRLEDDNRKDEFNQVADAFQMNIAGPFDATIGYSRNQVNQHELWLIPIALFPTPPSDPTAQAAWSFGTARPLKNDLGTDVLSVPDFTQPRNPGAPNTWEGYPLREQPVHFVDQDFDELGRCALALIEREGFDPNLITASGNTGIAETTLQLTDHIAWRLAASSGDQPFLIPLFSPGNQIDLSAIARLGVDAFLTNLNAFYNVDTFIQLPLKSAVNNTYFTTFEGNVINPFPLDGAPRDGNSNRLPAFSDVLLKAGEQRVTVLYRLPPGTNDPVKETPAVPSLKVQITHVQQKSATASVTAFNQGPWLTLVTPVELYWAGIGKPIPVAIRRFPAKPVLKDPQIVLPGLAQPHQQIGSGEVTNLVKWGWSTSFVVEGLSGDNVYAQIRYNEPDTETFQITRLRNNELVIGSLLHCLIIFKLLSDNWLAIQEGDRLSVLCALLTVLAVKLDDISEGPRFLAESQRDDNFLISFPREQNDKPTPLSIDVMNDVDAVSEPDTNNPNAILVTMSASPENPANKSYLIADTQGSDTGPIRNFRPSLWVTRNEQFGLNPLLLYRSAVVEAPRELWARNSWTPPVIGALQYQPDPGQSLDEALTVFFQNIFNGAPLASIASEITAGLQFDRDGLSIHTPFSMVPIDRMPATAGELANLVYQKLNDFCQGQRPAELDNLAIRIHLKISERKPANTQGIVSGRTLIEIAAIDFPWPSAPYTSPARSREKKVEKHRKPPVKRRKA